MDRAKILRLLNEADDIVSALYRQGANKDYKCKSLREKLKAIVTEITAPPKTNGDRIRQMTDKELAEVHTGLIINAVYSPTFFYSMLKEEQIMSTNLEWLRKKVDKDDKR